MANQVNIQTIIDGPRNLVVKVAGVLDTSDVAYTIIANPLTSQGIDWTGTIHAADFVLMKITYSIEDLLSVNFYWDATTPQFIEELVGRGQMKYFEFGGLTNNSGAGRTGSIGFSTKGWQAGSQPQPMVFTAVLELVKTAT
jgi:hypothetical protein